MADEARLAARERRLLERERRLLLAEQKQGQHQGADGRGQPFALADGESDEQQRNTRILDVSDLHDIRVVRFVESSVLRVKEP